MENRHALLAKQNPVLREATGKAVAEAVAKAAAQAQREGEVAGQLKSLFIILGARGLLPTQAERARIIESAAHIDDLLIAAATCASIRALLGS